MLQKEHSCDLEYFEKINIFEFIVIKKIKKIMCSGLETGIDLSHIQLIMFIGKQGQCRVSDIAQHCNVTLSAITNLANKLVNMRVITRKRSKKDRRIVHIQLTDKGKKQLDIIKKNRKKLYEQLFSNLSEKEIMFFFSTFDKILVNLLKEDQGGDDVAVSV